MVFPVFLRVLFGVEGDGVEDGFEAFADEVELVRRDVADSADIAAAEVVDDEIEAIAGVVAMRGVDLVAGFGADGAVLIVTMGEGFAADRGGGDGSGGLRGGLVVALPLRGSRSDAEVEERTGEGGGGVGIEGDGSKGAHAGGGGRGADVESKGAELGIAAREIPGSGNVKGDSVLGIVKGAGGRGCGFGDRRRDDLRGRRKNGEKRGEDEAPNHYSLLTLQDGEERR